MHHCHPRWGSWLMSGPGWRRSRGESAYGGPFGRHRGGPFGGRRGSRMFDQGALRLVVLGLIAEEPRHGYDVIKALEERFAGTYSPSPGSIYPMLQMLEEADLVSSVMSGNKRLFSITDAGRGPEGRAGREGPRDPREGQKGCGRALGGDAAGPRGWRSAGGGGKEGA